MSEQENPLVEAIPESIDELFSRDPLLLSDADVGAIVAALRRDRAKYLADGGQGKAKKAAVKVAVKPTMTIEDLDL